MKKKCTCGIILSIFYFTFPDCKAQCTEPRSAFTSLSIPGIIEAENYDKGCEGQSYHDSDPANQGSAYRTNGVDIEVCKEGGYNIGWSVAGEWQEYTVNVPTAGMYNVAVRLSSAINTSAFHLEVNGTNQTGKITVSSTGDWQNWSNVNTSLMLPLGNVVIRMFYETGDLNFNSMSLTQDIGDGLTGQYFNGENFEQARITRKDPTINFDWQTGSPDPSVNSDGFSVRWTGQIASTKTENYTFYINSDNGRRLWINNQLVIDGWVNDYGKEYTGNINLEAGKKYDFKLEYFENIGGANCRLEWSSANQVRQVVPQSQLFSSGNMVVAKPGFSTPTIAFANDWVATDPLNRTLPVFNQTGPSRSDKYIGMFYWLWHPYIRLKSGKQKTVPEILMENPNSPAFECNDTYWGEPENGFYHPRDPWSTRRNLQMLANAGVDFIYIDFTNGAQGCDALGDFMSVALDMNNKGIPVPKVVFFLYANTNDAINCLMDNFYNKPAYQPLWFYWEGKPLIMADQARSCSESARACTAEVKDFFTWKKTWAFDASQWNFLDNYPQKPFSVNGVPEQIAVHKSLGAPLNNHDQGSSYHDGIMPAYDQYWQTPLTPQGLFFEQYWKRAHEADPKIVCVTGWNELCAAAWPTTSLRFMNKDWNDPSWRCVNNGFCLNTKNGVHTPHGWYFVDEFNTEFNRDIEPMKGGYTDTYYYQLVNHVRKHKGLASPQPVSSPKTIKIDGQFAEWSIVSPVFKDAEGDCQNRNYPDVKNYQTYTNTTGRNDVVESRATADANTQYFYVKTASPITPYNGSNWMLLYIDSDKSKATGWEGFDYVVNMGGVSASQTSIKKRVGNVWSYVGEAVYKITGNEMELAIPRTFLGFTGDQISFNYQIFDNPSVLDNIEDNFIHGESAPDRRFNYPVAINSPYSTVITSLRDQNSEDLVFSVYPNPASHIVTVKGSSNLNSVIIKNASGVTVYQKSIHENKAEIDISNFEPGLYSVVTDYAIRKLIIK